MSRIGPAPLQKANGFDRSWLQWFSTLGNALGGRWGQEQRSLEFVNFNEIYSNPAEQFLNYKGRELSFLFVWESGLTTSSSSILLNTLPTQADLTMRPGMLQIWEDSALVAGAYASQSTITLPDLNLSGRVIMQGSVLTKITDPRRV